KPPTSAMRAMLKRVAAVGMYRRHGHGTVRAWDVERVEGMSALDVLTHRGAARRHLPASWCDAPECPDVGAVRAPSLHRYTVRRRVRRGTPTGLRPEVVEALGELQ